MPPEARTLAGVDGYPRLALQRRSDGPAPWFFDAWSHVYDLPVTQWVTYHPVHDAVLEALPRRACHRLLDLGCGTGQLAVRMKQARPHAVVTGCDFSAGMLSRARARSNTVRWIQADATRLPFRDAAFDALTSTEAFHWFPDQAAALAECHRVLAPGGRLLIALVNPHTAVVSELAYASSRLMGQPFYWPTSGEMRRRLETAGFQVQHQRRILRLSGLLFPAVLTYATRPR